MKIRPRGRVALAALVLLLIAVFLPPWINVGRIRARIATSIGNALGRRTTVDRISLRLLPQPGFDLEGVTIADDPAFGVEPMLHADQVTATLRLSSLWRGDFEVAKLSLKYPSLNLVRAADGRWNVENLLEHASRIPTAPTTKSRPESRPRFPYIEAEGGRINFKLGVEKMVYSLADADFALWLASEDEARARLAARMVRTDSYLSDTGTFNFEGRFQRAWNLRDTPMSVTASVENAQLGQLTKLFDGLDRGWRGAVDVDVALHGTPSNLAVSTRADIVDFRRYDITSVDRVRLEGRCTANFSAPTAQFSNINCRMPMSDGNVSLRGSLAGILGLRSYDLTLAADKVPLQQLVAVARHAKKNLPDDLSSTGDITAAFTFRKPDLAAPAVWEGSGKTTDAVLRSTVLNPQLALKAVEFQIQPLAQPRTAAHTHAKPLAAAAPLTTSDYRLAIAPFAVPTGAAASASVAGWFSLDGYNFTVAGDSDIPRLIQIAKAAGLLAPDLNADGSAKLDLAIAGRWANLNSPKPIGTAQLRNVKVRMKGVAAPLQIASATLVLDNDAVAASNISASFADSRLSVAGSVRIPRQCDTAESCPIHFDLRSDQVSTDELNSLFNPRVARRPWYAFLGGPEPSIFRSLNATGNISIAHVTIKALTANRVTATAQIQDGKLALTNIQADIFGGRHRGQWTADFTGNQPLYSGTGTVDSASMPQLASLMQDNWATGVVTASYSASLRGFTATDLLTLASGEVNFDWRKGVLRHVSLNGANPPLSFTDFTGALSLQNGKLSLAPESKLTAPSSIYQVSGTASLGRQIDLTLRNSAHAFSVTGTIEKPKVMPAPESRASLKQ